MGKTAGPAVASVGKKSGRKGNPSGKIALNIYIKPTVHQRLKSSARTLGVPIGDLIRDLLVYGGPILRALDLRASGALDPYPAALEELDATLRRYQFFVAGLQDFQARIPQIAAEVAAKAGVDLAAIDTQVRADLAVPEDGPRMSDAEEQAR
ncbi:MAG: hypothetical protein KAY32_01720 [Candidatus Eisenbacteria sp.]|nr:hypothetical protein [Candidatus Eisenbacteria bacterium]